MATTLTTLRADLAARGFDYLSDSRKDRYINRAYTELCEAGDWPFLEASTTGTSPLTIADLRQVLSVTDSTNDVILRQEDRRVLLHDYGDLVRSGNPSVWFFQGGDILTYPATSSVTLAVRYLKVPADLASGSDTIVVPDRYSYLIVDNAVRRAYQDSDNFEAAEHVRREYEIALGQMRENLLWRDYGVPMTVQTVRPHEGVA